MGYYNNQQVRLIKRSALLILSFNLVIISNVKAETCKSWQDNTINTKNLSIGDISIETLDIFNNQIKKENTLLHRTANKIHITTKEFVIRGQLLFKTGDTFDAEKLKNSERLLRANRYIKDASILPTEICSGKVNIKVITRDNWSLTPGMTIGHSGGKSKAGISVKEQNLFGLGKELVIRYIDGDERDIRMIRYIDPQLMNSRKRLLLLLQDNSDGYAKILDLNLPFYDLDSEKSWGIRTSKIKKDTNIYDKGEEIDTIGEEKASHSISYGWLSSKKKHRVTRFRVGWQYNKYNFFSPDTNELISPAIRESYPWVEYENRKDVFIKKTNFKLMGRTEDVQIGENFKVALGLLHKDFGSDNNYLKLSSRYSKAYDIGENQLFFLNAEGSSYLGEGPLKGETFDLKGYWYSFNETGSTFHVSGRYTISNTLKTGEQLTIGGSNEKNEPDERILRGYPFAYQTGNKRALVTLEKRFHYDWYPFNLVKFGAVLFTDIGSAWDNDEKAKILSDVGVGLRLFPTRSSSGSAVHFDLAVPLSDRDKVDNYQFLLKISNSF